MGIRPPITVAAATPISPMRLRRHIIIVLAYLAGYMLLDWISYVHPFAGFGITPWNPPTGLSIATILLFGARFLPWLFVAPVLADAVVRDFPLSLLGEFGASLIIGGGYSIAALVLRSPRIGFDPTLSTRRSLLSLLTIATAGAAIVASAYVMMLVILGNISASDYWSAMARFWIGDVIGIAIFTPFLLTALTRRWVLRPTWELAALLLLVVSALWLVFGFADAFRFQLFYLFFLPIIWTAVRFGLEGVTCGLLVIQIGLIITIHFAGQTSADATSYQALMIVLTFTGLAVGVLISEQQRIQQQLRLNQEALSRALRLSTMGEFAAALAHEINQPLTAIANYTRLAKSAESTEAAAEAWDRVIAQVDRTAEVVRRLREFIHRGSSETGPVAVSALLNEALSCLPELDQHDLALRLQVARELPLVSADMLQISQVLVNLLRNSAEALSDAGRYDGKIIIEADRDGADGVVIRVRDNGPGFDPDLLDRASSPFTTTKNDGLGLGLSLVRSIIEAHGGRLSIESSASGATVSFTLLAAPPPREEATMS
jgi:two-component system sensor kinase FixL